MKGSRRHDRDRKTHWTFRPFKVGPKSCAERSGTENTVRRFYIPGERRPLPHRSESFKTCNDEERNTFHLYLAGDLLPDSQGPPRHLPSADQRRCHFHLPDAPPPFASLAYLKLETPVKCGIITNNVTNTASRTFRLYRGI
jgi:hypothetical protein